MGKFFDTKRVSGVVVASFVSLALVAVVVYGATTISTGVNTGGTLDVSGASTLTGAVTMSAAATVGTTLSVTGNATFDTSTMFVDAANNRVGVLTITPATALEVVGTASSTGLVVGGQTTITGLIKGTCKIIPEAVTATTTIATCRYATGVATTDTIFVQSASSTLASAAGGDLAIFISSARSTTSGQIELGLMSIAKALSGTASGTINFWAVR